MFERYDDSVTSQNFPEFQWSKVRARAAVLVAEDQLTDEEIASSLGITRRTLTTWKQHPEFVARVSQHVEKYRAAIEAEGIASRQNRVAAMNDRWHRMQTVIEERADDPSMADVPGGSTGLIVHDVKAVGKDRDFQLIDIYSVDTGLLKELRAHEQQAAQELGQWTEKRDLTSNGKTIEFTLTLGDGAVDGDEDA